MKDRQQKKWAKRERRHLHVRNTVLGTAERPRLSVYRSLKHIHAQIIDDIKGHTLTAVSTLSPDIKKDIKSGGNVASATIVGKTLAEAALKKGIQKVVFDRGSYPYHGRIKALAEAARKAGLKF
ncbi:MAG: 50S ribosomal protein L18 [Planctomycetota bacterium]